VRDEHADALGSEEGGHREEVVLEPLLALREAQAVLLQQRAAEQLVRRQEPERRVGRAQAVAVDEAQVRRASAAVPDDLADHDVGAVLGGGGVQALERVWIQPVVVVGEEDELAPRRVEADVAGPPGPARVRNVQRAHARLLARERVEPRGGSVARAVVDEDQLALRGGQRLVAQRGDQRPDQPARLEHRDDDADLRHPGLLALGV
jgi:hypothetical protein